MPQRNWNRDELLLAMNLYCRLPFGRMSKGTPEIIELAAAISRTPSSVAMKLYNLASLDPAPRGISGLTKASAADRAIWDEFHANWESAAIASENLYRARVAPLARSASEDPTPTRSVSEEEIALRAAGPTDALRTVRVRTAQDFFRRAVFASYRATCCITGIDLPELLIASHILPWASFPSPHRINPRNGLCLSRLHDAAFDRGIITFDEEMRLMLSRDLRDNVTNSVLSTAFAQFEGRPLTLPEKFLPERAWLGRHREEVFRG